jgi:hypothetical protein
MKAHKSNNHTFLWLWSTHATARKIVLKYLWYIHYVMTNWGIFACSMFLWNSDFNWHESSNITFRLQFLHVDYKFVSCNFISWDVDTWVLTTNRPHRLILLHKQALHVIGKFVCTMTSHTAMHCHWRLFVNVRKHEIIEFYQINKSRMSAKTVVKKL